MSKTVRFSSNYCALEILSRVDYTDEEKKSLWYNQVEREELRNDYETTIRFFRTGLPENPQLCYMGLEHMDRTETLQDMFILRQSLLGIVIQNPRRQNDPRTLSANGIADASIFFSSWSRAQARDRAKRLVRDLQRSLV